MRSFTTSCWPYTVIALPVSASKSMRWRWPSNGDLHAVVHECLAVEALGEPEAAQELDARVLEHAGADALLDVLAAAVLEHDRLDAPRRQEVGQDEPGRSGADDPHLGPHLTAHAGHGTLTRP